MMRNLRIEYTLTINYKDFKNNETEDIQIYRLQEA